MELFFGKMKATLGTHSGITNDPDPHTCWFQSQCLSFSFKLYTFKTYVISTFLIWKVRFTLGTHNRITNLLQVY